MRNIIGWTSALLLVAGASAAAAAAGCGDSSAPAAVGTPSGDAGPDAPEDSPASGPVSVTLSPTMANVLTCSKPTFTATVKGPTDTSVAWTVTPEGVGTVDINGKYTAPTIIPQPPTATVTATALADPTVSASASIFLATAFVGKPATIAGSATTAELASRVGVYPHSFAASGTRAYGAWTSNPASATTVSIQIARSDDGGTTWKPAVTAISAKLKTPQTTTDAWFECPAVTIDPKNPDIVYVIGKITGSNSLATSVGGDDQATVLAVSKDGGVTFTPRVMHVGSGDTCPDLTAPASGTIVVEAPSQQSCASGGPDLRVWSDANSGDGFANGSTASGSYVAAGLTLALGNVNKAASCDGRIAIANGSNGIGGEATEAPRLFTNGTGRLCITYIGTVATGDAGTSTTNAYAQCSDDAGKTFSDPVKLDPDVAMSLDHSSAVGAFSRDGSVAIVWMRSVNAMNQSALPYVAISRDGGKTFSAPSVVPTYVVPGSSAPVPAVNPTIAFDGNGVLWFAYRSSGGADRILVDKTCDLAKTWSGAVLVNGPEASVSMNGMKWPALLTISGDAPSIVASASAGLTAFTLGP